MITVYSQSTNITKYSYHSTHTARYLVRLLSSKIVDIRKKPLDCSSKIFLDGIRESALRAFLRCANRYPIRITQTRDLFSGCPYSPGPRLKWSWWIRNVVCPCVAQGRSCALSQPCRAGWSRACGASCMQA